MMLPPCVCAPKLLCLSWVRVIGLRLNFFDYLFILLGTHGVYDGRVAIVSCDLRFIFCSKSYLIPTKDQVLVTAQEPALPDLYCPHFLPDIFPLQLDHDFQGENVHISVVSTSTPSPVLCQICGSSIKII